MQLLFFLHHTINAFQILLDVLVVQLLVLLEDPFSVLFLFQLLLALLFVDVLECELEVLHSRDPHDLQFGNKVAVEVLESLETRLAWNRAGFE